MSLIHQQNGAVWKAVVVSHLFQTGDISAGLLNGAFFCLTGCPHYCLSLILCSLQYERKATHLN